MSEIDVNKCKYYRNIFYKKYGQSSSDYCLLYEDKCDKYPQCIYRYKQLQQLKKENEELKNTINKLGIEHENYDNLIYWQMKEQQDKLKAENEELRKIQIGYCQGENLYNLYQYKATLDEIEKRLKAVSYLDTQTTRILKMDIENIIKQAKEGE